MVTAHIHGAECPLDLLVIVSESELPPVKRDVRAYCCLRGIFVPIDVIVKTRAEVEQFQDVYASLECEILERGKVLYDRSKIRRRGAL